MNNRYDSRKSRKDRLRRFLDRIQQGNDTLDPSGDRELLHEVQVYQSELEAQNKELLEAKRDLELTRNRYACLYDFAPNGYVTTTDRGVIRNINLTGANLLGYPRDELLGLPLPDLMNASDTRKYLAHLRQLKNTDGQHVIKLRLHCQDGETRTMHLCSHRSFEDSTPVFLTAFQDVTAEQAATEKLRLAARVFESSLEAIVITDNDFRIETVNRAFTRMTDKAENDVLGRDLLLVLGHQQRSTGLNEARTQVRRVSSWQGEFEVERLDETRFPAWGTLSTVRDETKNPTHQVMVFSDISKLVEAHDEMTHLAHHDPLTGLPNRLFFNASLEQSLKRAKRHHGALALMYVDLDHFKTINDTLGHSNGDELLVVLADRLKGFVREEDLVSRLGGDEFIILLNDVDSPNSLASLATKVLNLINRPIELNGQSLVTGASIGISCYPGDARTSEDLIKTADAALYRAKDEGRNHLAFYAPELTKKARRRLSVEQGIHNALRKDQLKLFYQPQQNLVENELSGFEGLLRWQMKKKRMVVAEEFIHVAEASHLISQLDAYALRTACMQASVWKALSHAPIRISVNLSPRSFLRSNLAQTLKQLFEEFQIGPEWIELEVTEKALQGGEQFIAELYALKDLGVQLAIDDFGTGYSCLASLKSLPIDRLKIDQSFIRDVPTNPQDAAIVRAIIQMGQSLAMKVIAEGVETQAQRDFLLVEGCDEIQGHFYHYPMSSDQALALVS